MRKNFQKGKQLLDQKKFLKRGVGKSFEKNDQHDHAFENHKHTFPKSFWCDFCSRKGHLRNFCWQAMKEKPKLALDRSHMLNQNHYRQRRSMCKIGLRFS